VTHTVTNGSFQTARLSLVPLSLGDAAAMVNGHRPPRARWAPDYPTEGTLVAAGIVVAAESEGHPLGPWTTYQVSHTEERLVIGDCGFLAPPDDDGDVHVAYGICASRRGHGYASEALRALVQWAQGQPGVRHVLGDTAVTNESSMRVLEAAGLRRVGADDRLVYYAA
jgi:RimJ/RimL family protein N-acetyltransferase